MAYIAVPQPPVSFLDLLEVQLDADGRPRHVRAQGEPSRQIGMAIGVSVVAALTVPLLVKALRRGP